MLLAKCNKELSLLEADINNVVNYWRGKEDCINKSLAELQLDKDDNDPYKDGCICLLKKLLLEVRQNCSEAMTAVSRITANKEMDSDSSDSESDSDTESDEELDATP